MQQAVLHVICVSSLLDSNMQTFCHYYFEIVSQDWNVFVFHGKVNYVLLNWPKLCYDLRCSSAKLGQTRLGSVGRKFDIKLSVKNVILCYTASANCEELCHIVCHVSPAAL